MINTECGIFSIISKDPINSSQCVNGLKKLQHRGRESFGIAYIIDEKIYVEKRMGLVVSILEGITSNIWLGHVRYSTSGCGEEMRFIQPQVCCNIMESFALVHNGNIPDYIWKKLLISHPNLSYNLKENNDTQLLIIYIEFLVNNNIANTWKNIIINIVNNIVGAYSIIIQTSSKTYLFRDKNAFKPLVYSKSDNGIVISSENYLFENPEKSKDVLPGEILQINNDTFEIEKLSNIKSQQITHCIFEYLYFLKDNNIINGISVNDFRTHIGVKLVNQISTNKLLFKSWENGIICGVPNSGICFAKSFSNNSNIEYKQFLKLNKNYSYRSFILKNNKDRLEACRKKFILDGEAIRGRVIILVDDSIVRGNTLSYLIRYIKEYSPKEIHFISGSPPIKYPCHYGIDFPDIEELIVNNIHPRNLADYYAIESLTYLDLHNLNVDGLNDNNICNACFTGKYSI